MRRPPPGDAATPATPASPGPGPQQPPPAAPLHLPGPAAHPAHGQRHLGQGKTTIALGHLSRLARRAAPPRRTVRLRLTALYGALFLASGAGLLVTTNFLAREWPWPPVNTQGGPSLRPGPSQVPTRVPAPHHQLQAQAAHAAAAAQQRAAELHQLLAGSAVALGLMAVVSVLLGWLVAGRVLRPLRAMTAATRAISEDNLGERLAVPGPGDELKDLGDTIDELLARLENAFTAQRRFVANASHELRTPLTTMRAALDVAVAKPGGAPAPTITLAGRLRTQLDHIDRLIDGLLALARAQHGALPGHATVALGDLAGAALAAQAGAITAKGLTVHHATGCAGGRVEGSPALLSRMAGNVIDNAVCHNHPGGWIRVATQADGPVTRLVVETGGDILDPEQVAQLDQPFRRLGDERTGSGNGAGLGLSIVAAIAAAHGGSLDLQARAEGGLRVAITLPLAADTAPVGVPA
jgi:signal transduction histidine kinase